MGLLDVRENTSAGENIPEREILTVSNGRTTCYAKTSPKWRTTRSSTSARVDVVSEQGGERRHTPVRHAARHDQVEIVEVGRHVEREPVARHPPGDSDADRGQLAVAHPDTRQPRHAPGFDAVVGRHPDQHFLEIAHVAVDVAAVGLQIDDGIADELAGAVVGDVAAAPGLEHFDRAGRKRRPQTPGCATGRRLRGRRTSGRGDVRRAGADRRPGRPGVRRPARAAAPGRPRRARGPAAGPHLRPTPDPSARGHASRAT